jgi:uncharacterized protein (DUF4415 family)
MVMERSNDAGTPAWVDPDDAPELTEEFFARADIYQGNTPIRRGRPPTGKAKHLVTLRIDQDVLEALRAAGPGWQSRVNDILRAAVPLSPGSSAG